VVSRSGRHYSVIPCTKRTVFESSLPALQGVSLVVTSVLSNFICDACTDPSHLVDAANAELQRHVTSLFQFLGLHPEVNVVIVPPLPRLVPDWFNSYLPCFTTYLVGAVSRCQSPRLQVMAPFVALPSSFESDGVHLNSASGLCFIQFLINGLDQILPSPHSGQTQTASLMPPSSSVSTATNDGAPSTSTAQFTSSSVGNIDPTSSSSTSSSMLSQAVTSLTVLTGNLRSEVTTRRLQDNLIFARLKEDQDYALNKNREDRFTVTGLRLSQAPPQDALARKSFFKELLAGLVLEACPDLDPPPQVLDVFVNMRYGRGAPFIEGRLDSAASSSAFRIAAAKLAKVENSRFESLFVANSVTLTTRVRIEILKAVAKLLTTETEVAYVQSFTSRPMLHYQTREGVRHQLPDANRSYSFVEAVGRWGDRLTTVMLLPAYKRARPAFIGCLEQYFVVLKESEPREDPSGFEQLFGTAPNNTPLGFTQPFISRGSRRPGTFRGTRASSGSSRGFAGFTRSDRGNLRKRPAPVDSHQTPSKRKDNLSAGAENITSINVSIPTDVVTEQDPEFIPESQEMN
jgi:hypothetical protein